MSKQLIFKTVVLLAVTTRATTQYIDFFQGFNSFLQQTTQKPRHDVTKRPDTTHRQTNKQKYEDIIFFETDDVIKQKENSRTVDPFHIDHTTAKPRRKSKTTTSSSHYNVYTTNKPKTVNSNKLINNNYDLTGNNNRDAYNNDDNRVVSNDRRIDNQNTRNIYDVSGQTSSQTQSSIYGYQGNNKNYENKQTTRNYNNNRQTTQATTHSSNNRGRPRQTTRNPLLNRPGVKPAAVDENRPPITNRPVTWNPVYDLPIDTGTYRPVNTRPPYDTPKPVSSRPTYSSRPANTRPPYETERPVVSRPAAGSSSPGTGSNEPAEPDIEIGPDEDEMSESEKRRCIEIAERKCDEYKSSKMKKVVALPLAPHSGAVELNVSSCAPSNVPLIIGGEVTDIRQFPHMALVGWRKVQSGGYSWKCGGSLISERFILTAGHCTYQDKDYNVVSGPPHAVQLGSSYIDGRDATIVQISVVIRHPKFKLRRSYYDVALIKMIRSISFSDTISPACIGAPPPVGDRVIATGWGRTEFGGDSSVELRRVSIPIWDMGDCREIWGTSRKLPNGPSADSQLCAGERRGAKDTCQGDSGGPAQIQDGCTWRVVAVTSVGRSCGAPETPALYAKLPRAFIASQAFANVKTNRDGGDQYGNFGGQGQGQNSGSGGQGTGNRGQGTSQYNQGTNSGTNQYGANQNVNQGTGQYGGTNPNRNQASGQYGGQGTNQNGNQGTNQNGSKEKPHRGQADTQYGGTNQQGGTGYGLDANTGTSHNGNHGAGQYENGGTNANNDYDNKNQWNNNWSSSNNNRGESTEISSNNRDKYFGFNNGYDSNNNNYEHSYRTTTVDYNNHKSYENTENPSNIRNYNNDNRYNNYNNDYNRDTYTVNRPWWN